jgi:hypothetical protein
MEVCGGASYVSLPRKYIKANSLQPFSITRPERDMVRDQRPVADRADDRAVAGRLQPVRSARAGQDRGDWRPDQFPTYADLLHLYQSPGAVNPADLDKPATGFLKADGSSSGFNDYASDPATLLVRGENNHDVAKAFLDFVNGQGLVYENGRYLRGD